MIKYEGVTFIKSAVSRLGKKAFVDKHINIFWLDRKEPVRRKMLESVYDKIASETEKK